MPIAFSRFAEVLDRFLSFEIGKKSLVSKLQSRLEAEALDARNYVRTIRLLGEVEQFIQELSFDLPCTVSCDKIGIGGVFALLVSEFWMTMEMIWSAFWIIWS